MSDREIIETWQKRLDTDFPNGAKMQFEAPNADGGSNAYLMWVPYPAVIRVEDGKPVIWLQPDDTPKDWQVTVASYEVQSTEPCLEVKITGTEPGHPYWLFNSPTAKQAEAHAISRNDIKAWADLEIKELQ